ncbi:hypothetical protein L210DRAFT_3589676, partial [Boletus edulis BED1]
MISGFDPTDGIPVINRRAPQVSVPVYTRVFADRPLDSVALRFRNVMVIEEESRPVKVMNWTTTIDDRCIPATVGFFVELAGDQ